MQMVEGALVNSGADLAISMTGIAGSDGGTESKPVGTVCMAWGKKGEKINSCMFLFFGDRRGVRKQAIEYVYKNIYGLVREKIIVGCYIEICNLFLL